MKFIVFIILLILLSGGESAPICNHAQPLVMVNKANTSFMTVGRNPGNNQWLLKKSNAVWDTTYRYRFFLCNISANAEEVTQYRDVIIPTLLQIESNFFGQDHAFLVVNSTTRFVTVQVTTSGGSQWHIEQVGLGYTISTLIGTTKYCLTLVNNTGVVERCTPGSSNQEWLFAPAGIRVDKIQSRSTTWFVNESNSRGLIGTYESPRDNWVRGYYQVDGKVVTLITNFRTILTAAVLAPNTQITVLPFIPFNPILQQSIWNLSHIEANTYTIVSKNPSISNQCWNYDIHHRPEQIRVANCDSSEKKQRWIFISQPMKNFFKRRSIFQSERKLMLKQQFD